MNVYYAHCQAIYDTPQEKRDVETLEKLGFIVVNPNSPEHVDMVKKIKNMPEKYSMEGIEYGRVMEYFTGLVNKCDILAFRALPDGAIPAGVAKEIEDARNENKPIIELPSSVLRRVISVDQTREYLKEVGQR